MAHHASAKKRHRQSLRRRERNRHQLSGVRNAVRRVRRAAARGDADLEAQFHGAERLLRKAATKGAMHHQTVSRTVSRLHKLLKSTG
jgi:small subunit ribosomal protein S20